MEIEKERIKEALEYLKKNDGFKKIDIQANIGNGKKRFSDILYPKQTTRLSYKEIGDLKKIYHINPDFLFGSSSLISTSNIDAYNLSYLLNEMEISGNNIVMSQALYGKLKAVCEKYNSQRDEEIRQLNMICNKENKKIEYFFKHETEFKKDFKKIQQLKKDLDDAYRNNSNLIEKRDSYKESIENKEKILQKLRGENQKVDGIGKLDFEIMSEE